MEQRRSARVPQKVIHRHRVGSVTLKRVSELVFVRGEPKAVLRWIDIAGVRTPIFLPLDASRLRRIRAGPRSSFYYDGTTVDPAVEALPDRRQRVASAPLPGGRRRTDPPARSN